MIIQKIGLEGSNMNAIKINNKTLNSRPSARDLLNRYPISKKLVVFDFSKVELVTRSFADEFYKIKNKNVKVINLNKNVEDMFNFIEHSAHKN